MLVERQKQNMGKKKQNQHQSHQLFFFGPRNKNNLYIVNGQRNDQNIQRNYQN